MGTTVEVVFRREVHLGILAPALDGPDGLVPALRLLLAAEKAAGYGDVGHCGRRYCHLVTGTDIPRISNFSLSGTVGN